MVGDDAQPNDRKALLLQALAQTRGIISTACASADVPRRTFYNWLEGDREFRRAYQDIIEGSLDFVESKLLDMIESGSERAVFFFLRTRGRSRGYRESGEAESELLSENPITNAYRPLRLRA
jgi:hypothetical protein